MKNNYSEQDSGGIIKKTYVNSKFTKFHLDSRFGKGFFDIDRPNFNDKPVSVIQVMLCGGGEVIVEYVFD